MIYPKLAKQAGLVPSWKNDEGEIEYIGNTQAWDKYKYLELEHEEMSDKAREEYNTQQEEINKFN